MKPQKRLLPFAILLLLLVIYFWEIITGRKYFWEDILYHYYPYHYYLFSSLRQFSLPLWNPFIFSGMPFLGDVQSQVFYPPNWLLAFFSSPSQNLVYWLVEMKVIIHLLLGGIFFYLLARELKLSSTSSLFSAIVFTFSGFVITHLIHLTMINTFIWFPLLLLFLFRTLRRKTIRSAVLAGIVLGISNLASHPQITLHITYTLLLFLVLFLLSNWRAERAFILKNHLPLFSLIFLLGFGLSGIQYLPSLEHAKHTLRETMTYEESARVSLPPFFPLLLLIPKFFGSITGEGTDSIFFWGGEAGYYYWETVIYIGIIPLIFAIFGAFANRSKERTYFIILTIVSLLAALGKYTPFYRFIFYILPGFDLFRIPARFAGLFTLGMTVLAGFGMESFIREVKDKRFERFRKGLTIFLGVALLFWLLFLFGFWNFRLPEIKGNIIKQSNIFLLFLIFALILFWLRETKKKPGTKLAVYLPSLAILLSFIDLHIFGQRFNLSSQGPEDYYPRNQLVRRLQEERKSEVFRINARKNGYMILKRNEGPIQGLELLEGYTPLALADYATFTIPQDRKYDLLNAKYKIKLDEATGRMGLVPNPTYLPRARMFYNYIVEKDRKRILEILSSPEFDYRNCLILEKEPEEKLLPESLTTVTNRVEIQRYEADEIVLKVFTEKPGLLFLSEVYYPEWKARVNGKEKEIYRADYCLRAISLDKGEHNVVLYYDRKTLKKGALITLLSLIGALFLLRYKRKTA